MAPPNSMDAYFDSLERKVREAYAIAEKARRKGFDPELRTEIPLAKDLADRVEGLVGPGGVAERIRELSGEGKEIVALKIAGEIAEGKFDSKSTMEERCLQALRTSLAILTEGVVAAPLEGIVKVRIKRNHDGSKYLAVYFAGPIRSAGGSDQAMVVLTADYIRRILGLDRYKPTIEEVERFAEEVELYDAEASHLQYRPTSQDVREAVKNIAVEITGEPTDKVEVSGYRDLERVETNRVRGGAVLVLAEGVLQKAPKIQKYVERLGLEGWGWLKGPAASGGEEGAIDVGPSTKYMRDLIAGRPVISHPSAKGGLRLRYGRCRNSGYAASCLHPATLAALDDFIAIGTQIKTERPGKGSAVAVCDSIEGPVVKLADGSVARLESADQAEQLKGDIKEILFVGDILMGYGEFLENNQRLMPSGYVEEWWRLELERAGGSFDGIPSQDEAIALSEEYGVPMHPRYAYLFHDVEKEDMKKLALWLASGEFRDGALVLQSSEEKKILELLCVPHKVKDGGVVIEEYKPLLKALGMKDLSADAFMEAYEKAGDSMELVNSFGIKIRAKSPTYIGARMGRPEKAKERRMKPPVNVLFPVGQAGGRTRDVAKAADVGAVTVEIAKRGCSTCGIVTHLTLCPKCGGETVLKRACIACGIEYRDERERCKCGSPIACHEERSLDVKRFLEGAIAKVGEFTGDLKGVIGMSSEAKIPEPLEKGILRSRHGVYVFKDGTIRFDATDMPLTHFKPSEIGASLELLKALGYNNDWEGKLLESADQLVELKCQDLILPDAAADYLLRASQFVDELLVRLYGLEPHYNAKAKEDLIGHLVLGLAPHTSAAVLGRMIGFTQANVGWAHPYFHAAKRRNCMHSDSEIFVFNSSEPKRISLREFYEAAPGPETAMDQFGTFGKDVGGVRVLSVNSKTGKVELKKIIRAYRVPSTSHLLRIQTASGRSLTCSPHHRLEVFASGSVQKRRAVELREGDALAFPTRIKLSWKEAPDLDLLMELSTEKIRGLMVRDLGSWLGDLIDKLDGLRRAARVAGVSVKRLDNFRRRGSIPLKHLERMLRAAGLSLSNAPQDATLAIARTRSRIPRIVPLGEELMRLVGYYLAEGYARGRGGKWYQVSIGTSEREMAQDIIRCARRTLRISPRYTGKTITMSGRLVHHLFTKVLALGSNAHEKRIPARLASLPQELTRELLAAYFSGDGSVENGRLHVQCHSVSQGLLRDIGFQLAARGIAYRLRREERLPGGAVRSFYERKGRPLKRFVSHSISIRSSHAARFAESIGFLLSRKQQALEDALHLERGSRMTLGRGDLVHDNVESIIPIQANTEWLYDLEVEDNHNFLVNDLLLTSNCDGDEDGVFLLMDALLNFSKAYLPATRGGMMDAPLVLTTRLDPREIDDEAHNIEIALSYPVEFYEATLRYAHPKELKKMIEVVGDRVGKEGQYSGLGFTHHTSDIASGPRVSSYKTLASMMEKVGRQLELAEKLRAVDQRDVAKRVVESHFLPDLAGNLRTFSKQTIRCVGCNSKYRRVPLSGKCRRCGGKLMLTVSKGGVEKYLTVTKDLIEKYGLDDYLRQRVRILEASISAVFADRGNGSSKQVSRQVSRQVSLSDFSK